MAGIGFRINRLLQSPNVIRQAQGALAALVVSSGPWLCTMAMIGAIAAMLRSLSSATGSSLEAIEFQILINYSFAGALVFFSTFELIVTRQVADLLYMGRVRAVGQLFERVAMSYLVGAMAFSILLFSFVELPWKISLICGVLMGGICLTWSSMVFLGAAKNHFGIVRGFVVGAVAGVACAALLGHAMGLGLEGFLLGIVTGVFVAGMGLGRQVLSEFGRVQEGLDQSGELDAQDTILAFRKHMILIALGAVMGLGAWIDKVIFWITESSSVEVLPTLRYSPLYDSGIFLGYLFVIPVLGYFLVQTETSFYRAFRGYFWSLEQKAPLATLETQRARLVSATARAISGLCIFQMMMTGLGISLSGTLVELFRLPPESVTTFRYALVGAGLHVLALFFNTLILYFDLPRVALRNYLIFLIFNGVGAWITAGMETRHYGLGYVIASGVTFAVSLGSLERVLRNLHFEIFQRQPLGSSETGSVVTHGVRDVLK